MSCEVAGEGMAEHMEATENRPFAVLRSRFERFPAGAVVNRLSSVFAEEKLSTGVGCYPFVQNSS